MHLVCNHEEGKTEAMLFGTQERIKDQSLDIQHRFNTLSLTSCYKYLGVKLDQTLTLREYVDSAYKKASGRLLYLLKRVHQKLTIEAAMKLYKSMILPVFTYCSILTITSTRSFEEKFSKFERRSYSTIYKRIDNNVLGKVSIRTLQKRRLCTEVFKRINGNVCNKLYKLL